MSNAREDRKFLWKPWATLVAIVAVFAVLPCGIGRVPPEAIAAGKVRKVMAACSAYATDNEGEFPKDLQTLIPDYLEDRSLLFVSGKKGSSLSMIYYPGLSPDDSSRAPLIEYPVPVNGKRIIGYVGGDISTTDWE